jgi:riboflavin-specific deaminase-like protein
MDRPFIHINCASTLDGKIARPDGSRLRISGKWDMERVHRLRADLGAVMVGAGTVIHDDPKLMVKEEYVPEPPPLDKIVIDGKGRIPISSRFLRTRGRSIVVTSDTCDREWLGDLKRAGDNEGSDIEILQLEGKNGRIDPLEILNSVHGLDITGILVEGGSRIIWEFVELALFDRFTIYYGPMLIGGKGPTVMGGMGFMEAPTPVILNRIENTPDGGFLVEILPGDQ